MTGFFRKTLALVRAEPRRGLLLLRAIIRGAWLAVYYRLAGNNVIIKFPFKAYAQVTIEGPGSVFIDENCAVNASCFKGLTIQTLTPQARVRIGKGCNLGGLTIRCSESVTIGDRTMTAFSLIQDSLFTRGEPGQGTGVDDRWAPIPIAIGSNVWLAMQCIVLAGSEIPDDCVIAAGSVCHRYQALPYTLVSGNPARRSLPIDRLLRLSRGE